MIGNMDPTTRRSLLALLAVGSLALQGCAASIAAGVIGAGIRAASAGREDAPIQDMRAAATEACRARALQHGQVHIIDAEQGRGNRVTVWGTVQDARERRGFECAYNGRITGFTLRAIPRQ